MNMRKRERENPCSICGHYHKYEEGEVCGICGHRMSAVAEKIPSRQLSAFPSEILPEFLYLGSYDNASRAELLKTQGISRVLNTVPACQNLYKNSFAYHRLPEEKYLLFDDANQFLEQCKRDKVRVLVHCMSGKSRSPAIVVAYLMRSKGWRLAQSFQWVKDRRPSIDITPDVYQQLVEYEHKLFGSYDNNNTAQAQASLSFGFSKPGDQAVSPAFNNSGSTSIFEWSEFEGPSSQFTFGAARTSSNTSNTNSNDVCMGDS